MAAKHLRLGLIGLNQTPLDWKGNLARIRAALGEARKRRAQIICYPELAVTGYGCEDRFLYVDTGERALRLVFEFAKEVGDRVVILGLPFWFKGELFNGAAVLFRGRIRGITLKSHLAREGIHYEPRWFHSWPAGRRDSFSYQGTDIPVGTLTYGAAGLAFGLEICEDAWVSDERRPCALLRGIQWVFNASASHFSMGKADIRERILCHSTLKFGIGYAYTNLVGCESGRAIYDGELLVAEAGQIVNRSDRLYLDDFRLLTHDINFLPAAGVMDVTLELAESGTETEPEPHRHHRHLPQAEQEFAMAASLALFDYLRKSYSHGFTLSLSGGVDSSAVAVLVWIMVQRLMREPELHSLRSKLAHIKDLDWRKGEAAVMEKLLTTVYQGTRNSGDTTREAAARLARGLGARHLEWDVDGLVEGYKSRIGKALDRTLDWEHDDIALQNIQARVRGPGVWLLANLSRSLLLSTSNRSEVAVGYATMDGDTCGGLAPIAGVEKSFLRRWLVSAEREGMLGFSPIPELALVNRQAPTAELRPPELTQTDETDLMPYEVLDELEEATIAMRLTPVKAFQRVQCLFQDLYSAEQLYRWTAKFCRMFAVSQWKRERYAPAFHLDDRNLDPKTWARFPILSGAFEQELEELAYFYDGTHKKRA